MGKRIYLYHEGIAKKSPNEVCSFVWHYLQNNIPKTAKKLYVFSDGCGGQNRNHTVVRFLHSLVSEGQYEKIYQYFPVRGHSFLPCDSTFGVIKRFLKRYDRVYTPEQYGEYIEKSSSLFTVHYVKTEEIINFSAWWPLYFKKLVLSEESVGKKLPRSSKIAFNISNFGMFVYHTNKVETQDFIDGLVTHTFKLRKFNSPVSLPTALVYDGSNSIDTKKMNDIRKVVQYVPDEFKEFYDRILAWKTTSASEENRCNIEVCSDVGE